MGTLLIIENDLTTREALAELLAKEKREIITAEDGQQALERLMVIPPPSLILLDLSIRIGVCAPVSRILDFARFV